VLQSGNLQGMDNVLQLVSSVMMCHIVPVLIDSSMFSWYVMVFIFVQFGCRMISLLSF
jgi:hypothetical protein